MTESMQILQRLSSEPGSVALPDEATTKNGKTVSRNSWYTYLPTHKSQSKVFCDFNHLKYLNKIKVFLNYILEQPT